MIKCQKCGKELPDGTTFCSECGEKFVRTIFCSNCGAQTNADLAFCSNCGADLRSAATAADQGASTNAKPGADVVKNVIDKLKKLPKKTVAIVLAVIIALGAVIAIISSVGGSKSKEDNFVLYIKDNELFYSDMKSKKTLEVSNDLFDGGSSTSLDTDRVAISEDGKLLFFTETSSGDSGRDLYYRDVTKPKKDAVKLDSDVRDFKISKDGKTVYYTRGSDYILYERNIKKDKEKIESDVDGFALSDDGKKLLFAVSEDGEYTYYLKSKGKDKEKLVSDIEGLISISEDLTTIIYAKDGDIYKQVVGKDKQKLASDVAYAVGYETGEFYYIVGEKSETSLSDLVEDDLASSDSQIPEAEYPYYYSYETEAEYDAALEAYEKYEDKVDRDELREYLKEEKTSSYKYALHYYDGKKDHVINENLVSGEYDSVSFKAVYSYGPAVIYKAAEKGDDTVKTIKMSKLYEECGGSTYSAESTIKSLLSDGGEAEDAKYYLASEKTSSVIELDDVSSCYFSKDGKKLYVLANTNSDGESDLYECKISGNKVGKSEKLDSDVASFYTVLENGKAVYFKDLDDNKGDLYVDKNLIDSDVYDGKFIIDEDTFLYYVDWNSDKGYGTLKYYKGGKKTVKVADDVSRVGIRNDDIVYISDYDREDGGTLYRYNNGKPKQIDTEVTSIVGRLIGENDETSQGSYSSDAWKYDTEESED